mmetsp:Transcript_21275/g.72065  ORF Transcript_21275/g.72065 Transcript_21275/m.72065 type:complete len:203 (+) Transcript_21275:575-1183(+)
MRSFSPMASIIFTKAASFSESSSFSKACATDLLAVAPASSSPFSSVSCPTETTKGTPVAYEVANLRTAGGHVAEKNKVDRFVAPRAVLMLASWGSNPMSNIRSASSKITMPTVERSTSLVLIKSCKRPGVATTRKAPFFRADFCAERSAPPKIVSAGLGPPAAQQSKSKASRLICCASSRVGARTRTRTFLPFAGTTKAGSR